MTQFRIKFSTGCSTRVPFPFPLTTGQKSILHTLSNIVLCRDRVVTLSVSCLDLDISVVEANASSLPLSQHPESCSKPPSQQLELKPTFTKRQQQQSVAIMSAAKENQRDSGEEDRKLEGGVLRQDPAPPPPASGGLHPAFYIAYVILSPASDDDDVASKKNITSH